MKTSPLGFCSNPYWPRGGNTASVDRTLDQHKNAICARAIASRSAGCRLRRSVGLYACGYCCAHGCVRLRWGKGVGKRGRSSGLLVCKAEMARRINHSRGRTLSRRTGKRTDATKHTDTCNKACSSSVHPTRTRAEWQTNLDSHGAEQKGRHTVIGQYIFVFSRTARNRRGRI